MLAINHAQVTRFLFLLITLLEASHENAQMDLESDMTPLKREVEQLRSQRINETQMSEVFRKMEREKKDLENQLDNQVVRINYDYVIIGS